MVVVLVWSRDKLVGSILPYAPLNEFFARENSDVSAKEL
jgi:hypothetical protein